MCVLVFVISLKGCKLGDFKRNSRDSCLADRVFATLMFKFTQTDSADENKALETWRLLVSGLKTEVLHWGSHILSYATAL